MASPSPIFLFTDFGLSGPYVGQLMTAVIAIDPAIPVVSLMHDAPAMRPDLAAYLLSACCMSLPAGGIVVAVVDPGVGGAREALIVETDALTFVGPDNGLLSRIDGVRRVRRVVWRPARLSATFHGRDLFAPVAACLATGSEVASRPIAPTTMVGVEWPDDCEAIVYIDGFGNAMTGVREKSCEKNRCLRIAGQEITYARTFSDVPEGALFWTANSQGLVEISANRASAAERLSLALGDRFLLD